MKIRGRAFIAFMILALTVVMTGCVPRGATANLGWTVVAATQEAVYSALPTGQVIALDAAQGSTLWTYPVPREGGGGFGALFSRQVQEDVDSPLDGVYGVPAITEDLVLIPSYDHHLYAFDRATGDLVWSFAADEGIVGSVTVREGIVYFGASDYRVYAVDVASGEPVWDTPFETGNWVWGAPAVDDTRVYVGSMDHNVYALERETGRLVWQEDLGASIPGAVTLADGVLYVGGIDNQLHALNAADGSEQWTASLGDWVWGQPVVVEGYVYATSLDGRVHGLDVTDGSPRWAAIAVEGALRAGPAFQDGHLIVGTEAGNVYRIDVEAGTAQQLATAQGAVLSKPAVVEEMVYVGTTLGNVVALNTDVGGDPTVWVYPPAE
ncbi:MAG TPA: PQQ-binding-like beta-propeller repeat protein [Chloroflexi bacterium]|nr:PQQ-binding-like beta-propeller repeat protein [Chloroflexota bacterium]